MERLKGRYFCRKEGVAFGKKTDYISDICRKKPELRLLQNQRSRISPGQLWKAPPPRSHSRSLSMASLY
jgi:hypothetical protein